MAVRFNPPPGWPPAPEGWQPPVGWRPDPAWPAPPPGWQLWTEETGVAVSRKDSSASLTYPATSNESESQTTAQSPVAQSREQVRSTQSSQSSQPVQPYEPAPRDHVSERFAPSGYFDTSQVATQVGQSPSVTAQEIDDFADEGIQRRSQLRKSKNKSGWLFPVVISSIAVVTVLTVVLWKGALGSSDNPQPQATTSTPGVSPTSASPSGTDSSTDPDPEPSTSLNPDNNAITQGSLENPEPINTPVVLLDWEVMLGSTDTNGWGQVATSLSAEDQEYYAPKEGVSFVLVPITITYKGSQRGALYDLTIQFVGSDAQPNNESCGWGIIPDELDTSVELEPGQTVTGNVCVIVPTQTSSDGAWKINAFNWDFNSSDQEVFIGIR